FSYDSSSNLSIFELYDSLSNSSDLLFEIYKKTQIENKIIDAIVHAKEDDENVDYQEENNDNKHKKEEKNKIKLH
ncbi:13051_t:CDS:1, partial [Funneliformis caledonium]